MYFKRDQDKILGGVFINHIKVFGQFENQNGHSHRTSAYLQWGSSEKSLGSFLLLNPGSAEPLDGRVLSNGEVYFGEVKADPSMVQIRKFVERIYSDEELNGRVHLYNLFTLQNPQSKIAVMKYELLAKLGVIDVNSTVPTVDELNGNPWICKCWGIHKDPHHHQLQAIKKSWRSVLEESEIPRFGKVHKNGNDFYHIRPRLKPDQDTLLEDLVELYRTEVLGGVEVQG